MLPRLVARYGRIGWLVGCLLTLVVAARGREWTDTTGKFKVEAELVAVRNGKAILEHQDGTVISVPVDKLSAADQQYLQSLSQPAAGPAAKSAPAGSPPAVSTSAARGPAAPAADPAALAQRAHDAFRTHCYRCHGEDGTSEGGFNFVLNLEKLAKTVVQPRNPDGSTLWRRMAAKDDSVMPPEGESPRPTAAELAAVQHWIEAGAPPLPKKELPREFISHEALYKLILADVQKAPERSRRFLRYFTLTHLHNAGVSADELQTYRNAFCKLLNSLSWNRDLVLPEAIDPARTVFRIDIRLLNWSNEQWEQIESANPYFLALDSPEARACNEATEAKMPYVRIDWFVFAASKPRSTTLCWASPIPTKNSSGCCTSTSRPTSSRKRRSARASTARASRSTTG